MYFIDKAWCRPRNRLNVGYLPFVVWSRCLNIFLFFSLFYQFYDCRNHVRVIQPMGDGSRLYVCGTNAHNPKDWVINVSVFYFLSFSSFSLFLSHSLGRRRGWFDLLFGRHDCWKVQSKWWMDIDAFVGRLPVSDRLSVRPALVRMVVGSEVKGSCVSS